MMHTLYVLVALSALPVPLDAPRQNILRPAMEAPSHYCGLHCVYAAARVLDAPFAFEDIVDSKYLNGSNGSTDDDLVAALHDVGLEGLACGFLTVDRLRLVDKPVILHVRPPSGVAYTHWVLFLGFDNDGRARLYDPPREFGSISVSELLSMWHGVGILVARQGENASVSVPLSFAFTAWVAGSALLIKLVPRCCQGWKLVVAVATILSGVAHLMLPTGFLRSPSSVNDVQAPFFAERVARLNFDETHRLINSEACYLVDARMRSAYADFHLPGAVNIPIDSGYLKLKREISRIDEGASVIVYCQSDSCSWAEQMAQQLAAGGVRKIYVYQGGVREWRAKASGT